MLVFKQLFTILKVCCFICCGITEVFCHGMRRHILEQKKDTIPSINTGWQYVPLITLMLTPSKPTCLKKIKRKGVTLMEAGTSWQRTQP